MGLASRGLKSVFPFNYQHTRGVSGTGPVVPMFDCASHDKAAPGTCAWGAVKLANIGWVNASIALLHNGSLKFTPQVSDTATAGRAVASAYGWGSVPMLSLYDTETDLPVIGWNETIVHEDRSGGGHLRIMSFSDFRPEKMSGWSNLGLTFLSGDGYPSPADTGLLGQLAAFRDFGIPSLYYLEITANAQNIFKNGVGLQPGWEAALEAEIAKIQPHFGPGQAIRGVALGDELCCRNISCWDQYVPYTAKLRALLGASAILYTNECALMGAAGWPENISIAPEFNYFSVDTYQWDYRQAGAGKAEVAAVKSAYAQLFPKLHAHQQMLVVPVRKRS